MRRSGSDLAVIGFVTWAVVCGGEAAAQMGHGPVGIRVEMRAVRTSVPTGWPVWVRFSIENTTDQTTTVRVPGRKLAVPSPDIALPLSHIFSGDSGGGLVVTTESGKVWDRPVGYEEPKEAPAVILGPRGIMGLTLDLREYFPALRSSGQFRIVWRPYGGGVPQQAILVNIAPRKRVRLDTDYGALVIRLFYDDAPGYVDNFLDLVNSGFYSGTTFHRLEPGYLIHGGCPIGDGTGVRPDGRRVPAEFNNRPHRRGTVAMALLNDDPNSASCQFFISYTRQREWDGKYTVFGELVGAESYATLDKLMNVPVDGSRPREPIYIRGARTENEPHDENAAGW